MKDYINFAMKNVVLLFVWTGVFSFSAFLAVYSLPLFLDIFESLTSSPLPPEMVMRYAILATFFFGLIASFAWLSFKGTYAQKRTWFFFVFSFLSLLVILPLDNRNLLMEEWAWIRYTTSSFLFIGALGCILNTKKLFFERKRILGFFWLFSSGALIFAALDELMQIHEKIGTLVQKIPGTSGGNDVVTLLYAITILVGGIIVAYFLLREYRKERLSVLSLLFIGAVVYLASVLLDTFDLVLKEKVKSFAKILVLSPNDIFSDAWSTLYYTREAFNGVEEVFEQLAATAFAAAAWLALSPEAIFTQKLASPKRFPRLVLVTAALVIALLSGSYTNTFPSSPLVFSKDMQIRKIADYTDGLFHSDDLFFHPAWGVLLANEGKGDIFQWRDNTLSRIPDLKKVLQDTDSLTATDSSIYVSDGNQHTIFEYTKKEGWHPRWTAKDGLKHPEALVSIDGALYILDQTNVIRLEPNTPPRAWKPQHPLWKSPESIAYDPLRKKLIITDDESGAVFMAEFEKSLDVLARFSSSEGVAVGKNGTIFVNENGFGFIRMIGQDGSVKPLAQFHRMYRDMQGITQDEKGNIYVVTADGFDNKSFMPSFLFALSPSR